MSDERRGLRTVALIKQVPKDGGTGELDADGRLRRDGHHREMNPWCRRAVTQAVGLAAAPGGRSTVLTMGPPSAADVLREALACGADEAVHLTDPALAGADCLATAKALASAIAFLGDFDLVIVGRSSVDGNTSAVGTMVAELLGLPFAGPVLKWDLDHAGEATTMRAELQSEDGAQAVALRLPAVIAVAERSSAGAKAAPEDWPDGSAIRTLGVAEVAGGRAPVSPTRVAGVRRTGQSRRPVILSGDLDDQVERAIDLWEARLLSDDARVRPAARTPVRGPSPRSGQIMVLAGAGSGTRALLGQAAVLADQAGARVVAVTAPEPAPDVTRLATWGADEIVTLGRGDPRPVASALTSWIDRNDLPWAILGTTGSWDRDVLGRLAVRLDAGLMSDLIHVHARTDESGRSRVIGVKPSGDSTLAEIVGDGVTQIATLRTGCLDLREPRPAPALLPVRHLPVGPEEAVRTGARVPGHDYEALDRAEVVIGVGLGVDPGRYAALEPLRALLDAELAATRKVTDSGRLPHFRQVGITARNIAPRLYLAFGILGNSNHMLGVSRAGTVVAVNNDPGAPVFAQCDIGIVADWHEAAVRLAAALERRTGTRAGRPVTLVTER